MLLNYFAHAGEAHESEAEATWHIVSSSKEPLIAITIVAIISLIVAARFLSAAGKDDEDGQK